MTGATALVGDGDATLEARRARRTGASSVSATTIGAPKAAAAAIEIRKPARQPAGRSRSRAASSRCGPSSRCRASPARSMANPQRPGEYTLDLAGGYGGVPGKLWTAKGGIDPRAQRASVDLVAAKFQLDRLAPLLAQSAGRRLRVDLGRHQAAPRGRRRWRAVRGRVHAARPQRRPPDDRGEGGPRSRSVGARSRAPSIARRARLELTRGDFVARELPFSVTGSARRRPRRESSRPRRRAAIDPRSALPVAAASGPAA